MTAIKSPELALFNAVFSYAQSHVCERVYDTPPDKQAVCPFIVLGTEQTTSTENKSDVAKRLFLTVHIWATTDQRQELELIRAKLLNLTKIRAAGFKFIARPDEETSDTITDTTVPNSTFLHGTVTLVYDAYNL